MSNEAVTSLEAPLQFERRYSMPREEIFSAWTDRERIKDWFAPDASFDMPATEIDLRVGGRYRFDMRAPDGNTYSVSGIYKEIDAPSRLVFSWAWESPEKTESTVTVELREADGTTDLLLVHEGLADEEDRARHVHGWDLDLARLNHLRDFTRRVPVHTSRERLFDAITSVEGLRGWWTADVTGSPEIGGELRFGFKRVDEVMTMRVDAASRPSRVQWSCVGHRVGSEDDEWLGTQLTFDLFERGPQACELSFRHIGLTEELVCYDDCKRGWEYFLTSLAAYAERGAGTPFD